jgi:hypothetical protein
MMIGEALTGFPKQMCDRCCMQEWTVSHMLIAAECRHETQQYCTQAGGLLCGITWQTM